MNRRLSLSLLVSLVSLLPPSGCAKTTEKEGEDPYLIYCREYNAKNRACTPKTEQGKHGLSQQEALHRCAIRAKGAAAADPLRHKRMVACLQIQDCKAYLTCIMEAGRHLKFERRKKK